MTWILLACALLIGGTRPARRVSDRGTITPPGFLVPVIAVAGVLVVLVTDRAALLLSACIAGTTVLHSVIASRRTRERDARLTVTARYLGHLVAALRAGSTVPDACARAAAQLPADAPAELTAELQRTAAHARNGGNGASILAASHVPELREVGALWALSAQLGIPVAELLSSARARMDHQLRHRQATTAALAGPRATAVILALLPLAGVLMGQAMGARPVALLTGGGLGGVLLLAGTTLVCLGFFTSRAIIGRAAT